MSSGPWVLLWTLGLFLAVWMFGALLLWLWDQLAIIAGWRVRPDTCLTCGRHLRRPKGRRDYRPHRCRSRY